MNKPTDGFDYRACFGTDAGKRVLADMLKHSGHFDTNLKTEGEIAIHNFMQAVLKNLGIGNTEESILMYVNRIYEIGVYEHGKKEINKEES